VNDLFERLKDLPEPPLRPSAEVLATARGAARRRNLRRATAGMFAAIAIIGGASLAADRLQPPGTQQLAGPAPSASAAETPIPQAPTADAVDKHATKTARALIGAVPPGYTATSVKLNGDAYTPFEGTWLKYSLSKGAYRAITLVRMSRDDGSGAIAAILGTDLPTPSAGADLCAANLDLGIEGATVDRCETATVDGVRVRLVSGTDPGVGRVLSALRYLRGGYVVVTASQGMRAYRVTAGDTPQTSWLWEVAVNPLHEKALSELPVTTGDLSALAAGPGLLP
jgi:hypothetical protein